MKRIPPSELILNSDGSIYHLNLLPGDLAPTIITVGDPERVAMVTKYFDSVDLIKQKREFCTHTGLISGKPVSVISTGIGTDNIDIVFNEIDALFNVDFKQRTVKQELTRLNIIRIGTSGALQADIELDSFIYSELALGLDTLGQYYPSYDQSEHLISFSEGFKTSLKSAAIPYGFYSTEGNTDLTTAFDAIASPGVTITNPGFYGPQNRSIRLGLAYPTFQTAVADFKDGERRFTNMEMETAGIYLLSTLLGHKAISLNAILANRSNNTFSTQPSKTVDSLIQKSLQIIAGL